MTTLRAHGFDNPAQLREHLLDLDDALAEERVQSPSEGDDGSAALLREIGWLRKEVADLTERAEAMNAERRARSAELQSWLPIAMAIAATFAIGRMAKRLHDGHHRLHVYGR